MKIVKTVLIGLAALFMSPAFAQEAAGATLPPGCALVESANQDGSLNLAPQYISTFPRREGKTFCCTVSGSDEDFLLHYTQGIFYLCQRQTDGTIRNISFSINRSFVLAPCEKKKLEDPVNSVNQDLGFMSR